MGWRSGVSMTREIGIWWLEKVFEESESSRCASWWGWTGVNRWETWGVDSA